MSRRTDLGAAVLVVAGLLLRLTEAARTYLNPDEAIYFALALPGSFQQLYLSTTSIQHPPLLVFLLHLVMGVSSSEVALRLIPVLAGSVFPWVVYRWLTRAWDRRAAFAALLILSFSPNLIALSAQVRGYTLALLFAALALLFLDAALATGSVVRIILFTASLCLAILSEYSAAWFAGAAGVYFLLRAREPRVSRRVVSTWAVGQGGALAIYGLLYRSFHALLGDAEKRRLIDGFLRGAFPRPDQNLWAFAGLGTLKQFAYTFSSISLGVAAFLLFVAGLVFLWKGRTAEERSRTRALAVFLVAPFLLACAGAILYVHPYGRTRHTVILSLFVATGFGVAAARLLPPRAWIAGAAAVALMPVWYVVAEPDQNNIAPYRHRRESMIAAMDYLRSSVPPGSLIVTDGETTNLLRYYLDGGQSIAEQMAAGGLSGASPGGFRVVWLRWDFGEADRFLRDLATVRREFGAGPLWVVDGGFDIGIDSRLRKRYPELHLPELRNFDGALVVFRLPPEIRD